MRLRLDPFAPSGVSIAQPAPQNVSINSFPETGVSTGTYGTDTQVGQFTVDASGRITFAQNVSIDFGDLNSYATLTKLGIGAF